MTHLDSVPDVGNGTPTGTQSFDAMARLTGIQVQTGTTTDFVQTRSFDNVGNVQTTQTTLPTGTDNQVFRYDQVNRLTGQGAPGPRLRRWAVTRHADFSQLCPELYL